ncbi:MAG TPA: hypothetical protein PLF81_02925 [Candidatus Anammoximicrobium sp.]|nr:hypothetical protein [Candidatus Anammoximicrobium sp.]
MNGPPNSAKLHCGAGPPRIPSIQPLKSDFPSGRGSDSRGAPTSWNLSAGRSCVVWQPCPAEYITPLVPARIISTVRTW